MPNLQGDSEFTKLIAGGKSVNLVQLMLELATDAYPDIDRVGCSMEIDQLGVACGGEFAGPFSSREMRRRLLAISRTLYEVEGFHGNRDAYYEPENSYLNEVLRRRTGIPISLGILYMAVAARVGIRMFGVNTPGHFVVGCRCHGELLFVDPFNGGEVLDREACQQRIEEVLGETGVLTDEDFQPATVQEIVARVLRNLKAAYAMQDCWSGALPVQQRLAALLPRCDQEQRDLGLVLLRTGSPHKALSLLETYVRKCGREQAVALEGSVRAVRKMAAELN